MNILNVLTEYLVALDLFDDKLRKVENKKVRSKKVSKSEAQSLMPPKTSQPTQQCPPSEVIDGIRGDDSMPLPQSDDKSNEIKKQLILASGKPLTASAVARMLDMVKDEDDVEKLRQVHKLIAAPSKEYRYLYPAFQFQKDGKVFKIVDGLERVLNSLARFDPWMQLWFLQTGDILLDNATPIEMLKQGKIDRVLLAAENYGRMCAA
jgi:hypothetical protein